MRSMSIEGQANAAVPSGHSIACAMPLNARLRGRSFSCFLNADTSASSAFTVPHYSSLSTHQEPCSAPSSILLHHCALSAPRSTQPHHRPHSGVTVTLAPDAMSPATSRPLCVSFVKSAILTGEGGTKGSPSYQVSVPGPERMKER